MEFNYPEDDKNSLKKPTATEIISQESKAEDNANINQEKTANKSNSLNK